MLFAMSLRKELARFFSATLLVLMTIVMTIVLIKALGFATRGSIDPTDALLFMFLTMLGYMPTLLGLSLFIGMVGTLSRMYRDHEMDVWFASGKGVLGFLLPMLRFAFPVVVVILATSLLAWPWASGQIENLRARFATRGALERIMPGQFQEMRNGDMVIFLEQSSNQSSQTSSVTAQDGAAPVKGRNPLLIWREGVVETITSASEAFLSYRGGIPYITMPQGHQAQINHQTHEIRLLDFANLQMAMTSDLPTGEAHSGSVRSMSSRLLANRAEPAAKAEMFWRLSFFLAVPALVLLALGFTHVSNRKARNLHYLSAALIFLIYYNAIGLGQYRVASGQWDLGQALIFIHGGALLLGLVSSWRRNGQGFAVWWPVAAGLRRS